MSSLPMRKQRRHKGFWVRNGVIGFFGCLVVLTSCINLWILQLHSQNQQQWLPETATTATTRQQAQVAHPNQPQQLRLQKTTTTTRQLPAAVRGGGEEGGRERVKAIFKDASIESTRKQLLRLPSWSQIEQYIGAEPIIVGLETCARFSTHDSRRQSQSGQFGNVQLRHQPRDQTHQGKLQNPRTYRLLWVEG